MYIGLMSGTSMDAIDAVIVDFSPHLSLHASLNLPIPSELKQHILKISHQPILISEYGELDIKLGELFAKACLDLLDKANISPEKITAIGSHGQTIFHQPNPPYAFSLQIGNANIIAQKTKITTVNDFRGADLAVLGQGAPLVPAFHQAFMQSEDKHRVIVNIGGMANITILPPKPSDAIIGFDTGPGNALLDEWIYKHKQLRFDENGQWAATGKIHQDLLDLLLQETYFQKAPPKSTGRELFHLPWLETQLQKIKQVIKPEDVQASLLALTAKSITDAIQHHAPETEQVFVCGGGAHNQNLLKGLANYLTGCMISTTDDLGIPLDWVEAIAFAWLAKQCIHHIPANMPSVTGAKEKVVLGAIYKLD